MNRKDEDLLLQPLLSFSILPHSTNLLSGLHSYPISVLLVDDQAIIAEAVRRMLQDQPDISFHYCKDPSKALEMAFQVKPTVILQDLVMPYWDGLVLVKHFRSNPLTQDIPIIVLSTKEDPRIKAEAFALGGNDYVVKLPDPLELIARIRYHSKGYIRLLERNEAFQRLEEGQSILNAELAEAAGYVRSLLPAPLQTKVKTDWRFIPSTLLGGDAFGYHWLDENHFAMYLLDVCGHGVGAALLSISLINLLSSGNLPKADFCDPSSVLTELNASFKMEKHNNMFFTMWYAVYDKQNHKLIYSTGGHPPALLITGVNESQAKAYELKTPGVVIGALPDAKFQNDCCKILPYNRLYIFSDGIYELSRKEGRILELSEFFQILKDLSDKHQDLDQILQVLQDFQENKIFVDDVSLLRVIFSEN